MLEYYNWVNNPDYAVHLGKPIISTDSKIKRAEEKRLRAMVKRRRKNINR